MPENVKNIGPLQSASQRNVRNPYIDLGRVPKPVQGQMRFDLDACGQRLQPLVEGGRAEPTSHRVEEQRRYNAAVFRTHLTVM